jgi:hypothetical protein
VEEIPRWAAKTDSRQTGFQPWWSSCGSSTLNPRRSSRSSLALLGTGRLQTRRRMVERRYESHICARSSAATYLPHIACVHCLAANVRTCRRFPPQGDDDELGLRFDTVWDEEQTHQIGVKVIAVFEGNSPDDTGGAAIGDWLISVGGIKVGPSLYFTCRGADVCAADSSNVAMDQVGKKSLAEIGRLICDQHVGTAAENREKRRSGADDEDEDDEEEEENEDEKVREKVRLVLQRGMGGDSPEEGGDFYHIDLQRGWLTGEEEDGDGFGSAVQDDKEREAREFLRKYVSGSSTKASVPG